jgi:hypothetical protein
LFAWYDRSTKAECEARKKEERKAEIVRRDAGIRNVTKKKMLCSDDEAILKVGLFVVWLAWV